MSCKIHLLYISNPSRKNYYNKKAQIAGQILIYILAIIIFSLTMLYGYKAVKYFTDQSTEISYIQLENNIKNEIEKVRGDSVGTIKKKELKIPGNYKDVCFVESYPSFPYSIPSEYPLINNHIASGAKDKNMFLAPPGDLSFYVGKIKVDNSVVCMPTIGGKLTLKLESMGNYVQVSEWKSP